MSVPTPGKGAAGEPCMGNGRAQGLCVGYSRTQEPSHREIELSSPGKGVSGPAVWQFESSLLNVSLVTSRQGERVCQLPDRGKQEARAGHQGTRNCLRHPKLCYRKSHRKSISEKNVNEDLLND